MANLIFKKGTYADFKAKVTTAQEGAFYLTEDEGGLYVGLADGSTKRIQGSVLVYDNIDAIVAAAGLPPYDPNVIYFSAANNALFRYDDAAGKWIQLNQAAESVTNELTALRNSINSVNSALTAYKTSNDAAVALKADQTALDAEISRAKEAEEANAAAAKSAADAASAAQATADTAKANAEGNTTSINALKTAVETAQKTADSKATMAEVEAKGYATVAQLNTAKTDLIGTSSDATSKNTIYAAKNAADAAKSAASGAQSTANEAKSAASANATTISEEVTRAKKAEADLTTAVNAKVSQSAYNTKIAELEGDIETNASNISAVETTAKAALPKTGGVVSGNITIQTGANIVLTDAPTQDTHAANKAYVDSAVKKANDVSSGLNERLTQAESDIEANAAAAAAAQSAAEGAQSTANTGVANAAKAQAAADDAAAAAKSANDNANTRVLQSDYDADKTLLDQSIESNANSISALQASFNSYKTSNDEAVGKKLDATTAASTYATKTELNTAKSDLLGTAADASTKNTIYGVQAGVAEAKSAAATAKSAADAAQSTADAAKSTASTNATNIANEITRAKKAEETLTTTVNTKASQADLTAEITRAKEAEAANKTAASAAQTTANNALPKAGGTMTGAINMNGKAITNLAYPSADTDAASKKYVDDTMAAADAMVFKGVLGVTGGVSALPTTGVQCGWTYKVGAAGTYGGISAKVGDLIINTAADNATPNWVHVTSGYEDDYLQKLSLASNSGVEVRLSNGVGSTDTKFVLKNGNGIEWTVSGTEATPSIVWGTF